MGKGRKGGASSQQAASLLHSSFNGGGFGGFGGNGGLSQSGSSTAKTKTASFETGEVDDTEVAFCLKKLQKRDPVTKLKALNELEKVFAKKSAKELREVVAGWSYSYNLASLANDKKVRAALYNCHKELLMKAKKEVGSQLKRMFFNWWVHTCDPCKQVVVNAKDCFDILCSKKETKARMLRKMKTSFLKAVKRNLSSTPTTLSDMKTTTQEQALERYERVVSSTLLSLNAFITELNSHGALEPSNLDSGAGDQADAADAKSTKKKKKGSKDATASNEGVEKQAKDRVTAEELEFVLETKKNKGLISLLWGSKRPVIRRSLYALLRGIALHVPEHLDVETNAKLVKTILGSFNRDKAGANQVALWSMVLQLVKECPMSFQALKSVEKGFLGPCLSAVRKIPSYGAHVSKQLYAFMRPLTSILLKSPAMAKAAGATSESLCLRVLDSIWDGTKQSAQPSSQAARVMSSSQHSLHIDTAVSTYYGCASFLVQHSEWQDEEAMERLLIETCLDRCRDVFSPAADGERADNKVCFLVAGNSRTASAVMRGVQQMLTLSAGSADSKGEKTSPLSAATSSFALKVWDQIASVLGESIQKATDIALSGPGDLADFKCLEDVCAAALELLTSALKGVAEAGIARKRVLLATFATFTSTLEKQGANLNHTMRALAELASFSKSLMNIVTMDEGEMVNLCQTLSRMLRMGLDHGRFSASCELVPPVLQALGTLLEKFKAEGRPELAGKVQAEVVQTTLESKCLPLLAISSTTVVDAQNAASALLAFWTTATEPVFLASAAPFASRLRKITTSLFKSSSSAPAPSSKLKIMAQAIGGFLMRSLAKRAEATAKSSEAEAVKSEILKLVEECTEVTRPGIESLTTSPFDESGRGTQQRAKTRSSESDNLIACQFFISSLGEWATSGPVEGKDTAREGGEVLSESVISPEDEQNLRAKVLKHLFRLQFPLMSKQGSRAGADEVQPAQNEVVDMIIASASECLAKMAATHTFLSLKSGCELASELRHQLLLGTFEPQTWCEASWRLITYTKEQDKREVVDTLLKFQNQLIPYTEGKLSSSTSASSSSSSASCSPSLSAIADISEEENVRLCLRQFLSLVYLCRFAPSGVGISAILNRWPLKNSSLSSGPDRSWIVVDLCNLHTWAASRLLLPNTEDENPSCLDQRGFVAFNHSNVKDLIVTCADELAADTDGKKDEKEGKCESCNSDWPLRLMGTAIDSKCAYLANVLLESGLCDLAELVKHVQSLEAQERADENHRGFASDTFYQIVVGHVPSRTDKNTQGSLEILGNILAQKLVVAISYLRGETNGDCSAAHHSIGALSFLMAKLHHSQSDGPLYHDQDTTVEFPSSYIGDMHEYLSLSLKGPKAPSPGLYRAQLGILSFLEAASALEKYQGERNPLTDTIVKSVLSKVEPPSADTAQSVRENLVSAFEVVSLVVSLRLKQKVHCSTSTLQEALRASLSELALTGLRVARRRGALQFLDTLSSIVQDATKCLSAEQVHSVVVGGERNESARSDQKANDDDDDDDDGDANQYLSLIGHSYARVVGAAALVFSNYALHHALSLQVEIDAETKTSYELSLLVGRALAKVCRSQPSLATQSVMFQADDERTQHIKEAEKDESLRIQVLRQPPGQRLLADAVRRYLVGWWIILTTIVRLEGKKRVYGVECLHSKAESGSISSMLSEVSEHLIACRLDSQDSNANADGDGDSDRKSKNKNNKALSIGRRSRGQTESQTKKEPEKGSESASEKKSTLSRASTTASEMDHTGSKEKQKKEEPLFKKGQVVRYKSLIGRVEAVDYHSESYIINMGAGRTPVVPFDSANLTDIRGTKPGVRASKPTKAANADAKDSIKSQSRLSDLENMGAQSSSGSPSSAGQVRVPRQSAAKVLSLEHLLAAYPQEGIKVFKATTPRLKYFQETQIAVGALYFGKLSQLLFSMIVTYFPTQARRWWSGLPKRLAKTMANIVAQRFSQAVVTYQIGKVEDEKRRANDISEGENKNAGGEEDETDESSFRIAGRVRHEGASSALTTGLVTAKYSRSDVSLGLSIMLPRTFPLAPPIVEFTEQLNVDKAKARRWQLNITKMLSSSDGSILDAVLDWKGNLDKQFEGIEECPVCYCVVHSVTRALPQKRCTQCGNKFHSACLYKWFESSGNSTCPLCRHLF